MVHRCSVALLALQASLELCAGRIRRVEVRATGVTPAFGGVLDTASARRVLGSRPGRATKQKDALAKDAAKWFGSRGYVVDNVGVTVEALPGGGGEQLVLSAAVLPCGRVRLRSNSTKRVRTRASTVARRLGLRRHKPFRWDVSRLARLTDEADGGLFNREGTKATATVEGGEVVLDMVVDEPRYVSLTPEVEINADSARLFLRVADKNVLGTGAEAFVETAYSKSAEPEFSAQVRHTGYSKRSWVARLKPLGSRALSLALGDGAGGSLSVDVEEISPAAVLDATPVAADDDDDDDDDDEAAEPSYVAFPRVASLTLGRDGRRGSWKFARGDRVGGSHGGPFARVGGCVSGGLMLPQRAALRAEPFGVLGFGAPVSDASRPEAVSAPRTHDKAAWDHRKDALGDAFEGVLVGTLLELSAPVPPNNDCTAFLFADAAIAADWDDGLPVADAAYGVAFQASLLRVDLTRRVGKFSKPALTLKLADSNSPLKCP